LETIEGLQKRTAAGAATFLVEKKAHGEESANEEADIQANKAISSKRCSHGMARQALEKSIAIDMLHKTSFECCVRP